jgi:dTDP-D-glucose 4,6-dehydratase
MKYTPVLLSVSEEYRANNVTVTVLLAPIDNITFTTEVTPLAPIMTTESTSRQLIISYNTEYNLSVIAATPCGNFIASTTLNYGEAELHSNNANN